MIRLPTLSKRIKTDNADYYRMKIGIQNDTGYSAAQYSECRPERIQKILSAHGVASRREAEKMIQAGRVIVNGKTVALGQSARFGQDDIVIDGKPLIPAHRFIYIMLNKPRGYVTTMRDERGRKKVTDLLSGIGIRVYPVGRLDMDSEGLILLTNDGQFANAVAHPSFMNPKTYEIIVRGDAIGSIEALCSPIVVDSHRVQAESVKLIKHYAEGGVLNVTIHEGRNRQIRKMCAGCGLEVLSLKRISIGALKLGSLNTGCWRYLTEEEVKYFG